ncbi:hypothetical protein CASFOL_032073 [Castilleja foliolosa]|uniref:Uncharacterized protein n=1 Tax=Castilleja foliolosa TaxID=1961234 RepID=A0ABD3C145_9LAMI
MSSSSFPLRFTFLFSLASAASFESSHLQSHLRPRNKSSCSVSPTTRPKATASDLLSILGPPQQAESVNSQVARDLWSCFKFLVPHNRTPTIPFRRSQNQIDELILWPPEPVLELARLALDSGADPGAIHRALDPKHFPVPDVERSNEDRCELTRTPYGRQFIDKDLNLYLEFLFKTIVQRGPSVGLNVSLSRYDFFHGHLFITKESGRLGILFHAKEYPAYDKDVFPYNMGYCQVGSNVAYDDSMNLRNILWLAPLPCNSTKAWLAPGVLVVLDASPKGIIYEDLIPEYVRIARTLYEENLGKHVVDVNYLNVGAKVSKFRLFIC